MKNQIVYIEWADAVSAPDKWMYEDNMDNWIKTSGFVVHHVGWLIEETKEHIVISAMRVDETEWNQGVYGHVHKIPKKWIGKMKKLR